ncbi:MAG TPA: hypothetical protein VF508_04315 [Pyrinomonadaceae bacterium]
MNREGIIRAAWLAFACAASVVSAGASAASAQVLVCPPSPPPVSVRRSGTMRVELPMPPVAQTPVPLVGGAGPAGIDTLSFRTPDAAFERNVVKGSPFTADSFTEHIQRLADGNRMARRSTAHLFRDAAGRTRREHQLARGGAPAPDGQEEPRLIIINDPVAQVEYLVDTARGTIRRSHVPAALAAARRNAGGAGESYGVLMPTSAAHRRMAAGDRAEPMPAPKKERLEAQLVEGVMAEGTRVTVTIPAGEFDNEQPLEITHEQWYSHELGMVVLMKHSDPRFGETTFRLANITRGDPPPDLFAEPQGYRTVDRQEPAFGRPVMRRP